MSGLTAGRDMCSAMWKNQMCRTSFSWSVLKQTHPALLVYPSSSFVLILFPRFFIILLGTRQFERSFAHHWKRTCRLVAMTRLHAHWAAIGDLYSNTGVLWDIWRDRNCFLNNIRFTFWDRSRLDTGQRPGELNKGNWNGLFLCDQFLTKS